MANEQNLIPLNRRTPEERREIGRKGAEASNKKQREKKLLKETLETLLEINDNQDNICIALIKKALEGDTKAFEVVRDSIGQRPSDKVDIQSSNITIDFGEIKGD